MRLNGISSLFPTQPLRCRFIGGEEVIIAQKGEKGHFIMRHQRAAKHLLVRCDSVCDIIMRKRSLERSKSVAAWRRELLHSTFGPPGAETASERERERSRLLSFGTNKLIRAASESVKTRRGLPAEGRGEQPSRIRTALAGEILTSNLIVCRQ